MNLPILQQASRDAYAAAMEAEQVFSDALERQYGKRAVDARYRLDMRASWCPALREAAARWHIAVETMRTAMRAANEAAYA